MSTISFDEFKKMDIRVAEILSAKPIEGTDKLIRLEIDVGNEKRTLVAGIADFYKKEDLEGKFVVIIANLEPRKIRGIESKGMILAAIKGEEPVMLVPDKDTPAGSKVC